MNTSTFTFAPATTETNTMTPQTHYNSAFVAGDSLVVIRKAKNEKTKKHPRQQAVQTRRLGITK